MAWCPDPSEWDLQDITRPLTLEVTEDPEPPPSKLLDSDGNPIPYQSKKLGFMGFVKLKERQC